MQFQTTIAQAVPYAGVGLHSGREVSIILKPAPVGTGIVFIRTDLPGCPQVSARVENVTSTYRATTLENGQAKVFTVEHLLAALSGLQVDNCVIEMNSPEPPVADGSALTYTDLIAKAGIFTQDRLREYIEITKPMSVYQADKYIAILPYDGFRVSFTSINPHPLLGVQYADYEISPKVFLAEIGSARTIGFMHEIEALKAQGLGLGGTLDCVVVYDEEKVLTPLRFEDELIRHKILDVMGDLALLGPLKGHVIAVKSGHAMNTELGKKIWSSLGSV